MEPAALDHPLDDIADVDEIERAFRRLSEAHRVVLSLQHILGLSTSETAAAIGVPAGTVKSRTHFALMALHAALRAEARSVVVSPTVEMA